MKYLIVSDIHSNLEALKAVLDSVKNEQFDLSICLGDLVGYGPDPNECAEIILSEFDFVVAGNHDMAVTGQISTESFNPLALQAIDWTRKVISQDIKSRMKLLNLVETINDLTLVHAAPGNPALFSYILSTADAEKNFSSFSTSICLIGHTHIPAFYSQDQNSKVKFDHNEIISLDRNKKYIINTGSVGQPRDNNPKACYAILNTAEKNIIIKRIAYNIKTVQKKMKKAGLPEYLTRRLANGK